MGIFGWSYPPGAANDPNAPYNQTHDDICHVCGRGVDDCLCPECQTCGQFGDPFCYSERSGHGLRMSAIQIAGVLLHMARYNFEPPDDWPESTPEDESFRYIDPIDLPSDM